MAYESPDLAPQEIELKGQPDARRMTAILNATDDTDPVTPAEFFRALNPKVFPPDLEPGPGDTLTQLAGRFGIITDEVKRRRVASAEAIRLAPIYEKYLAARLGQIGGSTQEEAAQFGIPFSPYPTSRIPAKTMQVDRDLVPDTFDIDQLQPRRPQDPINYNQRAELTPEAFQQRTLDFPERPNPQARLRPNQAALLGAEIMGVSRGRQPQQIPAGLQEFNMMVAAERAAKLSENGGAPLTPRQESDILMTVGKIFSPGPKPGSPEEKVAKVTAEAAQQKSDTDIAGVEARTKESNANTKSLTEQLEGRMKETAARTRLADTQAGTVGQKAAIADELERLNQARATLQTLKFLSAKGNLSTESENLLTKTIIELLSPNLIATPKEAGFFPSLVGKTQGEGVNVTPSPNPLPRGERPAAQSFPVTPPPINLTNPAEENLKALRKMSGELKEGEIRAYKGQPYTKMNGVFGKLNQ